MVYTFSISPSVLRDEEGAHVLEVSLLQLWLPCWSQGEVLESACSWQDTKPFFFSILIILTSLYPFPLLMSTSTRNINGLLQISSPHLFCTSPPQSTIPPPWVIWNSQLIISKIPTIPIASLMVLFSPLSNWNLTVPWGKCSPWIYWDIDRFSSTAILTPGITRDSRRWQLNAV